MNSTVATNREGKEKSYYSVGVLEKAFRVIELMSRESRWELGRLAQASAMPKGTLQRILLTLVELGYINRDRGSYALNLEFYRLGQRIAANNNLLEHARPHCRALMEAVNERVNLCVALNTEMVVIDQQVSWQMLRLDSIIGASFPIFQSASGKTWCAFLDELNLLRLMQEIRREKPEIGQGAVDNFLAELKAIRLEGLGFDREELFRGVRCLAAPIFDCTGKVVATVGCSVPTVRVTGAKAESLMREVANCARRISHSLGAAPQSFSPGSHSILDKAPEAAMPAGPAPSAVDAE